MFYVFLRLRTVVFNYFCTNTLNPVNETDSRLYAGKTNNSDENI